MNELQPIYDSRKSFYGKAHVIEEDNKKTLASYTTEVAEIVDGVLEIKGFYSATTTRHIREFLLQNGFKNGTKEELAEMYMK